LEATDEFWVLRELPFTDCKEFAAEGDAGYLVISREAIGCGMVLELGTLLAGPLSCLLIRLHVSGIFVIYPLSAGRTFESHGLTAFISRNGPCVMHG